MTSDVTIVVIALIATAFALHAGRATDEVPVLRARKQAKRKDDGRRTA
jgi:hypothetical protein